MAATAGIVTGNSGHPRIMEIAATRKITGPAGRTKT
jgi:hypothetical protein